MRNDHNAKYTTITEPDYPDRWVEIPPNGKVCPHTGLKHGKLYTLLGAGGLARPHVRVANLRDPRAVQGKTIFHLGDMRRFLDSLARAQASGCGVPGHDTLSGGSATQAQF